MSFEFGDPKQSSRQESKKENIYNRNSLHYLSIQEKEFLKTAENEGFVHQLKEKELLVNARNSSEKRPLYGGDVKIVYLSNHHLNDVSIIDICDRLQICILSNNFIQHIKPLKWCTNLVYIDLHSNVINHLPGKDFWSSFHHLSLLHLHDNGLSRLEELRHLSHAPSLMSLTLYDTPLSLKKTYRHCVVNAIFTLKALDYYVISDEEIIEDVKFPMKFKPLQPQFLFKSLLPFTKKTACPFLKKALSLVGKDVVNINRIQAKYSPVLLLQKCIRGFLIRLRFNYLMDTRLWAAVSIQRFYRGVKGYPTPPPCSPCIAAQESFIQSLSSIKLDYETYLKMRRSRHRSTLSMKSDRSLGYRLSKKKGSPNEKVLKHISIDLEHLQCRTTELFEKATSASTNISGKTKVSGIPANETYSFLSSRRLSPVSVVEKKPTEDIEKIARDLGLNTISKNTSCKVGKYFTQYEFLGEVMNNKEYDNANDNVDFRLSISKPHVMKRDPIEENIIRTLEAAEDIRQSIKEIERRIKSAPPVKVRKTPKKVMNSDEKLYMKTQGSMGLSCFYAVNKAYKDRQKAEQLLTKMNYCQQIQHNEKKTKHKINRFKETYKSKATVKKHDDRVTILEGLAMRRQRDEDYLDQNAAKRVARSNKTRDAKEHYKFALDFNCQNNSIGKALINHDTVLRNDGNVKMRTKLVSKLKAEEVIQQEKVNDYLEQTKMARQAERMNLKGDIDLLISRNTARKQYELADLLNKRKANDAFRLMTPTVLPTKEFQPPGDLFT